MCTYSVKIRLLSAHAAAQIVFLWQGFATAPKPKLAPVAMGRVRAEDVQEQCAKLHAKSTVYACVPTDVHSISYFSQYICIPAI